MNEAILADTPLENPEEDRLGFAPFASNLADAICKVTTEDCLIFALYGQWGSGKTTSLNFVLHYINEKPIDERPLVVRFNPWWFSGHGDLLNQFFREFRVSLGKEKKFKAVVKLLAGFAKVVSKVPEPKVGKIAKCISWLLQLYSGGDKEAWQIRDEICKDLQKQTSRVLIIIDDIDRLSVEEIRSVFRVIKAVADFTKTIYLLAFDKDIVAKALEAVQETFGQNYLKKIVQVPVDLPIPDKITLRKLFFEELDIILSSTPQEPVDKTYWGNVFFDGIDPFLNTIRDVKRLTNALRVTYPTVKGEVNTVDFVAIETLRVFSSDIYQLIRTNPDMFAGHSDTPSYPKIEDIKPFHEKWLNEIPEKDKDVIKKLLIRIFPKVKTVFENMSFGATFESTWRRQLRICSPNIFPVYFRLAVSVGEISNTEMQAILALSQNSKTFANKLLELSRQHRPDGFTRVSAFLERMQDYTEKDIPKEHIPEILQALFEVGDDLLVPEDAWRGFYSLGNDIRIDRIIYQLLQLYKTQDDKFNVLKEVISKGRAVSIIVSEVTTFRQLHEKYCTEVKHDNECIIGTQYLEELEVIALKKIKEAAKNKKLLKAPNLSFILKRWRDWEGDEPVRKWVAQVISDDEGLVIFLTSFLSKSYATGLGDWVSTDKWRFDLKFLKGFLEPTEIAERCKNMLKTLQDWLKDEKKIAIEEFIKAFEQGEKPETPL